MTQAAPSWVFDARGCDPMHTHTPTRYTSSCTRLLARPGGGKVHPWPLPKPKGGK